MSDLKKYIAERKKRDKRFAKGYDEGYEQFKTEAKSVRLFQKKAISLGKAVEMSGMSRTRFMRVLKKLGIPAYEYSVKDFNRDQQAIKKYREAVS
jgi:predicted HTH domain antitoxin